MTVKEKTVYESVNVFHGTGKSVDLSKGELSCKWNSFKGKAGNTSPAACLPFGNVTCAPYSGGYPTGYGNFKLNSGEPIETFFDGDQLVGFSHFTQSGVGGIKVYYNYLVTVPFVGETKDYYALKAIDEETARPGYYACRLVKDNIRAELTVESGVAIHRYTSLDKKPLKIAVDISNDGLCQPWEPKVIGYSKKSQMHVEENGSVSGYILMQGVKLYFYIACPDGAKTTLWKKAAAVNKTTLSVRKTKKLFGCLFDLQETEAIVRVGFSLTDVAAAKRAAENASDFDVAVKNAQTEWENRLSKIELFDVSAEEKEKFYSNFYHTIVKPCSWEKESFLWQENGKFYFDFATLWDIYKTQTPLLFTLYEDVGKGIVKTLLRYGKEFGGLFNTLLLSTNRNIEANQACCLGCYVLYDAYVRGLVEKSDYQEMLSVVKTELSRYKKLVLKNKMQKTTQLLDVTLIAAAFAEVARDIGTSEDVAFFEELATYWTNAFGENGLLKEEYPYYEGNHWNYSFRFVKDVQKRIMLGGGKENIVRQLDAFFAFNDDNVVDDRFEGFNNETDMETPYFYLYVGEREKFERLMEESVSVCFKNGREACPGNNDSGGLSACYMWNYLGLFPISGQDKFFVGAPQMPRAVLHVLNGKTLEIQSSGNGKTVQKVLFNGTELADNFISVQDVLNGGVLQFVRGE